MQDWLSFGDFTIDLRDERLLGRHGPVRLGNKAYRVLLELARQEGRLLTKDALFSSVWDGTIVSDSALTSVIKELRRALGDESRKPVYIESIYGRGYRLLPEVSHGSGGLEEGARPSAAPPAKRAPSSGGPPLLYIPGFDDAAVRDTHPHLAGLTREEILTAMSRFRDIRLVSDEATAAAPLAGGYGDRDYQLSIKLADLGPSVRAFARLTHLASQSIIWADSLSLAAGSLAADIDALTGRVAAAALPRLRDDLFRHQPAHAEHAYDLYLATRLRMRAQESFAEARDVAAAWEALIAQHPDFAPAYPPLTRLYNTDYCYSGLGATGAKERRRAYELAHKAFAIDPTESHLQTVKGWSHLWAGEAALARQHLNEALQLNPYNRNRLIEVSTAFMYLDDLDGAAELLRRCRALMPSATATSHEEEGLLHLLRGEYEEATASLALGRRHHPEDDDRTEPAIMTELYALLAAAGAKSGDLASRSRTWRERMARRWCGPGTPEGERLTQWVLFHNPFQSEARKAWLLDLLSTAIDA